MAINICMKIVEIQVCFVTKNKILRHMDVESAKRQLIQNGTCCKP